MTSTACHHDEWSSPLSSAPSSVPSPLSSLSPAPSDSDLSEHSDSEFVGLSIDFGRSYPSPSSSKRSSAETSPAPENMPSPPSSSDGDDRPRKKRKLADPKERTTGRLDLRKDLTDSDKPHLDRLLKTLHKKRKIVVIAGAGISVSAGIPDFRSSTGLFKSLRKEHKRLSSGKDLFDASVYQDDSSTSSFHDMVRNLSQQTKNAQPTAFHHLLATLAHEGRLLRLYTQNVDGIDTSLEPLNTKVPLPKKNPWPKTIQLHGGLDHMVCTKCHAVADFDAEKFNGPVPPACPTCLENDSVRQVAEKRSHGIGRLRPRMVLYNEHNPDDEAIGSCVSADLRTRPDAVIVAGTTLKVPGVRRITREMCATVRDRRDGVNIWINNDPEPLGKDLANVWDLVIQGPCDEVAKYAAMPKWDDPIEYKEVTDEEVPKQKPNVVITKIATPKTVRQVQGQLTPAQSPRIAPQPSIKEESNDQPSTPSKKGTKRKSDGAKTNAFAKMGGKPPVKASTKQSRGQAKKATNTKSKAKKETKPSLTFITDSMKAKKKDVSSKDSKVKIIQCKYMAPEPPQPIIEGINNISISHTHTPSTPTKTAGQITGLKRHMAPISASDSRYNQSPKRPEVEGFTPIKPRTPNEQLHHETFEYFQNMPPTSDSRPSTASSRTEIKIAEILN